MRLAVISDIHGNLPALEAVHAEIKTASPDLIVNLGDCLSGPLWPEETAQYLIAENWPTVRGNHDRALAEMPPGEMDTIDAFAYRHLTKASREGQIRRKLGDVPAELVLCGHTHTPRIVHVSDRLTVLNPGSVGVQAFPGLTVTGSPHARYAIATRLNGKWSFTLRAIDYDWSSAARRAEASGFANWSHGLSTGFAANAIGT